MKLKIKISTAGGGKPFIKQLPSFNPIWDNCEFFINENIPECDLWVVYGGISKEEKVRCSPDNVILLTNEPPSVKKYSRKFTDQFGAIITCQRNIKHKNVIFSQQALPWWVGHKLREDFRDDVEYSKTYDELKSISITEKKKVLSVIVSNKTFTKGHKKRLAFAKKLKESFGSDIDLFGFGFNLIEDKWDAIAPYKYHIALENSSYKDYWTEKLADTFLGQAYPIYYGCHNIYDYFPENSLTCIDINKPNKAIEIIRGLIENNTYEKSKDKIKTGKELILNKYQLFPMLSNYINTYGIKNEKTLMIIDPEDTSNIKSLIKKVIKIPFKKLKK